MFERLHNAGKLSIPDADLGARLLGRDAGTDRNGEHAGL